MGGITKIHTYADGTQTRSCGGCKAQVDVNFFYKGRGSHCKKCSASIALRYYHTHKAARQVYMGEYNAKYKTRMYEILGSVCVRCGFSDKRALQIDHVNGGGGKDRIVPGTVSCIQKLLEFPGKYQLLCANCNSIKRIEEGADKNKYRPKRPLKYESN